MSPLPACISTLMSSFPRVSGDEPTALTVEPSVWKFSPRERG